MAVLGEDVVVEHISVSILDMATPKLWCIILTDRQMKPKKLFKSAQQKIYIPIRGDEILSLPWTELPIRVQAALQGVSNLSDYNKVLEQWETLLNVADLYDIIQLQTKWAVNNHGRNT